MATVLLARAGTATLALAVGAALALASPGVPDAETASGGDVTPVTRGPTSGTVPLPQEARSAELLRAVAGTPPVACELVQHALANRWGGSSVRPRVHPPVAATAGERALAAWAWTTGPGAADAAALVDGLASEDPCVRRIAARLLADVDDPATVATVTRLARTGAGTTRLAAIMALGSVERPEAAAALGDGLRDGDPDVRRASAWALGGSGRLAPLDALAEALTDGDVALRENAAWALGRIERREGIDALVRALGDAEPGVRFNAAWALGEIEDERAIPALASLLGSDGDVQVRRAAAWALGRIED